MALHSNKSEKTSYDAPIDPADSVIGQYVFVASSSRSALRMSRLVSFRVFLIQVALVSFIPSAPANPKDNPSASPTLKHALELFTGKSYAESRDILQDLVSQDPSQALYWFNLGNAHFMLEEYDDAILSYQKAIHLQSPLTPAAWLYIAKSYRKISRHERARRILIRLQKTQLPPNLSAEIHRELSLLEQAPPDANDLLAEGIQLYRHEKFNEALSFFDTSLQIDETAEAHMMKALTLLQMEKPDMAKTTLSRVIELAADNPELRDNAQDLLRTIREKRWEKKRPYWLYIDIAGGYNSNIFLDGRSETDVAAAAAQAFVSSGYRFSQTKPFTANLGYYGSWEEALGEDGSRIFGHILQSQLNYERWSWTFRIAPTVEFEHLGTAPFLYKTGATGDIRKIWEPFEAGVEYRLKRNFSASETYDYLAGFSQRGKLYIGLSGARYYTTLSYVEILEDSGDFDLTDGRLPLAYGGRGPSASLAWLLNSRLELFLACSYTWKYYDHVEQPHAIKRDDQQFYASAKLAWSVSSHAQVYTLASVTRNSSTLGAATIDDKNYTQVFAIGGLSWDVFP